MQDAVDEDSASLQAKNNSQKSLKHQTKPVDQNPKVQRFFNQFLDHRNTE